MRSWTRGFAGALTVVAAVVAGAGCAGEGHALGSSDDIEQVEPEDLVPVLLTEDDDVDALSYGPIPMTSENRGDDDYYQSPPTQFCEESPEVEVLADGDMYAYLGDGGDYLYIDHWVTGEPLAAAIERFDDAVAAMEHCGDDFLHQIDISHPGIDDVRRYETREGEADEYFSFVYARNGGVVTLLAVETLNPDRYDGDDVD